jgi:hypothetical protein
MASTTTAQDVINRAAAYSSANVTALTSDSSEMLDRIRFFERQVYTKAAQVAPDWFTATAALTSTGGPSGRSVDLSTQDPPVERVVMVTLSGGTEVAQVDLTDTAGELAPRYYVRGQSLVEVSNDWNTASSAAQSLTLIYVQAPAEIDVDGSLTQTLSLDDAWTSCVVYRLAHYLAHKDVGREVAVPGELERLESMIKEADKDFLTYLTHFGGVAARRFDRPAPEGEKD